jgi:hypothetical protein
VRLGLVLFWSVMVVLLGSGGWRDGNDNWSLRDARVGSAGQSL